MNARAIMMVLMLLVVEIPLLVQPVRAEDSVPKELEIIRAFIECEYDPLHFGPEPCEVDFMYEVEPNSTTLLHIDVNSYRGGIPPMADIWIMYAPPEEGPPSWRYPPLPEYYIPLKVVVNGSGHYYVFGSGVIIAYFDFSLSVVDNRTGRTDTYCSRKEGVHPPPGYIYGTHARGYTSFTVYCLLPEIGPPRHYRFELETSADMGPCWTCFFSIETVYVDFWFGTPRAVINRTAIELRSLFGFRRSFGYDLPVQYNGPQLPRNVEQAVLGVSMIPETVSLLPRPVELMPDWAVRGEISRAIVGVAYGQPGQFGVPFFGSRWTVTPQVVVLSPHEFRVDGKIESSEAFMFPTRVPYPFGPYLEFPLKYPVDVGMRTFRIGNGTYVSIENVTFVPNIVMDMSPKISTVLNSPQIETGNVIGWTVNVAFLAGPPLMSKFRSQILEYLQNIASLRKIWHYSGREPPTARELAEVLQPRVMTISGTMEDVVHVGPDAPQAAQQAYQQGMKILEQLRDPNYLTRVADEVVPKVARKVNAQFPIVSDWLASKARDTSEPLLVRIHADWLLYNWNQALKTGDFDRFFNRVAILGEDLQRTWVEVRYHGGDPALLDGLARLLAGLHERLSVILRAILNEVDYEVRDQIKKGFSEAAKYFDEARKILQGSTSHSAKLMTIEKRLGRTIEPRFIVEVEEHIDLADALSPLFEATGTAVAAGLSAGLGSVIGVVGVLGFNALYMHAVDTSFRDPIGTATAAAGIMIVETGSQRRLLYTAAGADISFGLFASSYHMRDLVRTLVSAVSRDLGYGEPIEVSFTPISVREDSVAASRPGDAIASVLSTTPWRNMDAVIRERLGSSSANLVAFGVLPIYVIYHNMGSRFFSTFVFDFVGKGPSFRGVMVSLKAAMSSGAVITDPSLMAEFLSPIGIDGATITRDDWKLSDEFGNPLRRPLAKVATKMEGTQRPPSVTIEYKGAHPVVADMRFNVTHAFIWDPIAGGGFGVPCLEGESVFRGAFQVIDMRINRYPLFGTSPPAEILFILSQPNATVREREAFGSKYMSVTKAQGYVFRVSGDAFFWQKVGEEVVGTQTVTYWDGILRNDVVLPIYDVVLGCGYSLDISFGDRDAARGGIITGKVTLDGSGMRGTATLPTKAIFEVFVSTLETPPTLTVSYVYGFYEQGNGGTWVSFQEGTRTVSGTYTRFEVPIQDMVQEAVRHANRTGKPVVLKAAMIISGAPERYTVIQPLPAEWPITPDIFQYGPWTLTVRTLDAITRNPIAGALVTVMNKTHAFNATTDSSGTARFTLIGGGYTVRASAQGYRQSEERQIVLNSDMTVDILLLPLPSGYATVIVSVRDAENGQPVQGALVSLSSGSATFSNTTDSTGTTVLRNVPFGTYELLVRKAGYQDHSRTVEVSSAEVRLSVSLLREMPKATVRVTVLRSDNNAPIAGATVQLENGTMIYTATTDSSGVATLSVPVGGYVLRVSASGFYHFSRTVYVPSSGLSLTVKLTPTTEPPEPPIPPDQPDETCPVPLTTFHVRDASNGNPIAGATVTLVRGTFTYVKRTDSSGNARFCVSNGLYSYSIEATGYQRTEGSMFITAGSQYIFDLVPLRDVARGTLIVTVIDASNLNRIADALVVLRNATHELSGRTDTRGEVRFQLVAGGYSISVTKPGYRDFNDELRFPGGTVNYTVSLVPHGLCEPGGNWTEPAPCGSAWFVADVRFRDGFPFAGASVRVQNSTYDRTVITDSTGKAKFLLQTGRTYTVTVSATYRNQSWSFTETFTLTQNVWRIYVTPWYSGFHRNETFVVDVSFLGPPRGIWNRTSIIGVTVFSNVPQTVTLRVKAINYTELISGNEVVLASKTVTLTFRDDVFNQTYVTLRINGTGFSLVAPVAEIISYQYDTDLTNNRLIGSPIPFGPLIDVSVFLYLELESAPFGANTPERTRYAAKVRVESNVDLDVPGVLVLKVEYLSAETLWVEERVLAVVSLNPRRAPQWVNRTFNLPWTNVTSVSVQFRHDLEIDEIDNNYTAYIYLDPSVKLVDITRVPATVPSGKPFSVEVLVISNWWPRMTYTVATNISSFYHTTVIDVPFGPSWWNVSATAPLVPGFGARTYMMNVTVGPDYDPTDNWKTAEITVLGEGLSAALPWILLLLAAALAVATIVAVARTGRRTASLMVRRRGLRRYQDVYDMDWMASSLAGHDRRESRRGHRRGLRRA